MLLQRQGLGLGLGLGFVMGAAMEAMQVVTSPTLNTVRPLHAGAVSVTTTASVTVTLSLRVAGTVTVAIVGATC